jgi:hypothetical protein
LPVLLRKTKFNFLKNIYNLALFASGANFMKVYEQVCRENHRTICEYLSQRGLI